MKQCSKCKHTYQDVDKHFYKYRKDDRYYSTCKKCRSIYLKEYNQRPEIIVRRNYLNEIREEEYYQKHGESIANTWNRNHRDTVNQSNRRRYKKNRKKIDANRSVYRKTLTLLKQRGIDKDKMKCIICGKPAIIHHNDMTNPFDIDWYCRRHSAQMRKIERDEHNLKTI